MERLTPPWLRFQVLSCSTARVEGDSLIEYRLKLRGVPIKWKTRILDFKAPEVFVDTQLSGPYQLWHHTHTFIPYQGGTVCRDSVRFKLPGGIFHYFTDAFAGALVKSDVRKIFSYRERVLAEIFPPK